MNTVNNLMNRQQINHFLLQKNYAQAVTVCERALETEPEIKSNYWYLGLLLLLQNQEAEAQTTWLFAMSDGKPEQVQQWVTELIEVLCTEAERQEAALEHSVAWAIRQHIREIQPEHLQNLLHLLQLSLHLETFSIEELNTLGVNQLLQDQQASIDPKFLTQLLSQVLDVSPCTPALLRFVKACIYHISDVATLMQVLLPASIKIGHAQKNFCFAAELAELYLQIDTDNVEFMGHLSSFYQNARLYERGIEIARQRYALTDYLPEKLFSSHLILRGLLSAGGYWQEALDVAHRHEALLHSLIAEQPLDLHPVHTARLLNTTYYLPYFTDKPQQRHSLQNQVLELCQRNIEIQAKNYRDRFLIRKRDHDSELLKIGYLSHCMATHSVGWLSRWLFQHHNRERFQIYGYFLNYRSFPDPLQEWFVNQVDVAHKLSIQDANASAKIAEKIYQDEIDILIDLDSITLDLSCEILALKPAPVQVTWLGWDASGLPSIDYFVADPQVLPNSAQTYYTEKIWRLPQTYIAVDGFEVGVPTLKRDQLGLSTDAIIFLSAQRGYKRHRNTAKLQLRIIKKVPNSYLLIKGLSDQDSIQNFFFEIAEEEGIPSDRLCFLPDDQSEAVHRANLAIADVVLDTFPYNGATTTLETLWMGIPLVTRVGEQFAARNSYTMMVNAGISEGIAWSDEEYVEWGVRLGKDAALRQKIHWDLMRSRQTAPLWNAKQFTRDMETAYQQMWEIYQRS